MEEMRNTSSLWDIELTLIIQQEIYTKISSHSAKCEYTDTGNLTHGCVDLKNWNICNEKNKFYTNIKKLHVFEQAYFL
jgi:hypothetical protein